jgi:hypothetical protein
MSSVQTARNLFFKALLIAGIFLLLLYFAVASILFRYGKMTTDPGWKPDLRNGVFHVTEVDPAGAAAGKLQENDLIVAVNGRAPRRSMGLQGNEKINMAPSPSYRIRILRNSQQQEITLDMGVKKNNSNLLCAISLLAASFISFFVAMLIGLSKPEEKVTQLATLMGLSVAIVQLIATLEPMEGFFGTREMRLGYLLWLISLSPLSVAFAFDFFHRFPADPEGRNRWRYVKYVLYAWAGAIAAYFTVIRASLLVHIGKGLDYAMERVEKLTVDIDLVLNPLMLLALPLICVLVVWNYKRISDPQHRYRIRWITIGAFAGITPTILYFVLQSLSRIEGQTWITHSSLTSIFPYTNMCLTILPLALGYAVIKHRLFGINVVVRLGFQYLLAKKVLQLLIYLPPVILAGIILANRDRRILDVLFSNTVYIALTVAALIGLKFRNSILELLDRKFFREVYTSEKILMQLIEDVENMDSLPEVSRAVSLQIDSALHPKRVFVFYRGSEKNELVLGHSSGEYRRDLRIPAHSEFLRVAENESGAQPLSFYKRQDVPDSEREWMESLGVQLVVPVNGRNQRIAGLLLLGEKKSEEAYTPQDKKLLKALARQIGVVYENLLLKAKVDQGMKVQRDVLSHLQNENRNLLRECETCGACFDSDVDICPTDKTELALTLPVDRTIDEKYQLERLLGRGGMGAVYEALDLRLQRKIAVKILVGSMFGDRTALSRFEREARASAKMNHPNIVSVYDFGGIEGKGAYLVMELLSGFTLRSVLKERRNLDPQVVAAWFEQIFRGVRASHQNGIIHRDLKPENIFVSRTDDGRPVLKILDLGLAKIRQQDAVDSASLTKPGTILGTLYYMSPEQVSGQEVDERTDIFSLGVMIVEALTGKLPFTGNTMSQVAIQILQKDFRLNGNSPETARLDAVLQKCLAKDYKNRFSSVAEMQEEMLSAILHCPPLALESGIGSADTIPN